MILKEWGEALDVYKATFPRLRRSLKAIRNNVKSSGYVWVAILLPILSWALFVFLTLPVLFTKETPKWWSSVQALPWLIMLLAIPCEKYASEKALAKEFEADYTTHGILRYPFWSRRTYFVYTLFLQELRDRKYSHEQVAELSKVAEIAEPPEVLPLRPFQHPLVIFIMGMLTGLCIEAIRRWIPKLTTDAAGNDAKVLLFLIFTIGIPLLGMVITALTLWYGVVNFPKNRHQQIKRYLQWAEKDLKEEKFS